METYEATVHKWWMCPRCGSEILCLFRGALHHNLDVKCPSCHESSDIPWPQAPTYSWTCSVCGHVQLVGVRTWDSEAKYAETVGPYGQYKKELLSCQVCAIPPVGTGLTVWHQFWQQAVFTSTNERHAKRRSEIQADTAAFDNWVTRAVPWLIARRNEERSQFEEKLRLRDLALRQRMQTLDGLRQMNAVEFETAVGSLYLAEGWEVFVTPRSGDRGIDLVLRKDSRKIAVQCKKYKATVSERLVREFYGSFVGHFTGGIFVTTSSYSRACSEWAKKRKRQLTLVNGETLADLMAEHKPPRVDKFELWSGRAG